MSLKSEFVDRSRQVTCCKKHDDRFCFILVTNSTFLSFFFFFHSPKRHSVSRPSLVIGSEYSENSFQFRNQVMWKSRLFVKLITYSIHYVTFRWLHRIFTYVDLLQTKNIMNLCRRKVVNKFSTKKKIRKHLRSFIDFRPYPQNCKGWRKKKAWLN